MKITVKGCTPIPLIIPVPLGLVLSLGTRYAGSELNLTAEQVSALKKALGKSKKILGRTPLVEVHQDGAESVIIRL